MQYVSRSTIGHLSGVVLVLLVPIALGVVLDGIVTDLHQMGQFPWWVVQFGTPGETITIYAQMVAIVSNILVPLLIFALGYHYGKTQTETPFLR
ncbi:hypothetical protein [Halocatena marina]|uniref:Uncharacterized protein n=1 Tax=Halocatena marina TaxID=2934937 RepID=A0ABD5YV04_9EURY|nr:hypothetical protein [Halocatena marina]